MVRLTEEAGIVPHFAREEAERRHQYYLGPEHLLLGLQVGDDNPAARVLRAHGLDLETVRAGIDRLVAEGVLPGPQPSDAELLATLGIDLDAVMARLERASAGRPTTTRPRTCGYGRPSPSLAPRAPGHRSSAGGCSGSLPRRPPPAARTPLLRTGCWRCFVTPRIRSRSPPTATR
jgi:Clp amino terminal domain, pathogenicity island component